MVAEPLVTKKGEAAWPFPHMVKMPWPYLAIMPLAYILLIYFGWTQDDYVESNVSEIWIPRSGSYAQDNKYAARFGKVDLGTSSIAAMAISRDGGNIFTPDRLEEIRARMEAAEEATLEWKGHTITWEDVCASNNVGLGTTYEFPCARITPLDYFQEAGWFFEENDRVTWRNSVIRKSIVKPIIPRFGIMSQYCPTQCQHQITLRNSEAYAVLNGYDASYANPLGLLGDIASMEMNDPCKRCIEENFEVQINNLLLATKGSFGVLAQQIGILIQSGAADPSSVPQLATLAGQYGQLAQSLTRADAEEFFTYYTTRGLYPAFNLDGYKEAYDQLVAVLRTPCLQVKATTRPDLICPNETVTDDEAEQAMLDHADGPFSSYNTAGSPFPWWSDASGTGKLFEGTSGVSGSGINMAGELLSMAFYTDILNVQNPPAWNPLWDGLGGFPTDPLNHPVYQQTVLGDPTYNWFMAVYETQDSICQNNNLTGTQTQVVALDVGSAFAMQEATQNWCTKHDVPNKDNSGRETSYTKQHFSIMWYDLFIDTFLGIEQGVDSPFTWTLGQGCGYSLAGERDQYADSNETSVLASASEILYYIDEGTSVGPIDRNILIGGANPSIEEISSENPLEEATVIQSLYAIAFPENVVKKVKNCNRPGGAIEDMNAAEAEEILENFKEEMEKIWVKGWNDDNDGEVQFVYFSDDAGSVGTTGRTLLDITLDNGKLMSISICLIAIFSIILLISPDWIESRVLVTLIGVSLVVLAYFASLGLAILFDIKINISTAWTLPFIIIGIGVDDVYIVLMSLKKQGGYSHRSFLRAMREVAVPVTMTSVVNCLMFAVMNISDIPAVYLTATVAVICVIALYMGVLFCFPAYCWLDMERQAAGKMDVFFCLNSDSDGSSHAGKEDKRQVWLYEKFYYPVVLGAPVVRIVVHMLLFLGALALLGAGIYGMTEREVGLGLEDFFPVNSQAFVWADTRTQELASWAIGMNWGEIEYTDPMTQQKMIKQFEDVVSTSKVAEMNTDQLWMSKFLIWSTRHCTSNFDRDDPNTYLCGMEQTYEGDGDDSGTVCAGGWMKNAVGLRDKTISDGRGDCEPFSGGICRPASQMFAEDLALAGHINETDSDTTSYCPFAEWSDGKFKWCLEQWRNLTNTGSGEFITDSDPTPTECAGEFYRDESIQWPIPLTTGPSMWAFDLQSHELTLDLLSETRKFCDNDPELHCWMDGIPYDYWSQYENVFEVLMELSFTSVAVGFAVAWIFLFGKIFGEKRHSFSKVFCGTLAAALIIGVAILICLMATIGISILAGVNLTGFSNMSFVLSIAFSVEYSVHVVSRWLRAPLILTSSLERVQYTMSFLMLPTFMAWISSTIGVVCLAFTEFSFTEVFFFRPLIIVMMVTYYIGVYVLPAFLCYMNADIFKLGKTEEESRSIHPGGASDLKLDEGDENGGPSDEPGDDGEKDGVELAVEVKEEAPKEEAPKEEAPKEETPKEEAPKEEAPKEETPKEEAPKEETPKEEAPKEETPKEEAPKEETSAEEAPNEEAPNEESSTEEAPKDEDAD